MRFLQLVGDRFKRCFSSKTATSIKSMTSTKPKPDLRVLRYASKAVDLAVVVNTHGKIGRFWVDRNADGANFGCHYAAILGEVADGGGRFAILDSGLEVYVLGDNVRVLPKGHRINVVISAEAKNEKRPRARIVTDLPSSVTDGFETFLTTLPKPFTVETITPNKHGAWLLGVMDNLDTSPIGIGGRNGAGGGGRLHWYDTPAMAVVDIDRAGRKDKGRAVQVARALNTDAVTEAARLAALGSESGLIMIDCVGPMPKEFRAEPARVFIENFKTFDTRKIDTLTASRLGIVEASIEARYAPVRSWLRQEWGQMIMVFIKAENALTKNPTHNFSVMLPAALNATQKNDAEVLQNRLNAQFGYRLWINFAGEDYALARK